MIRTRIQAEVEKEVSKTQYRFRPAKSTAHAIYVIRKIQDFVERSRHPLFLTLLDREKTFGKVDHKALCEAMKRLGIEEGIIETLRDGYSKATFYVEDENGKSDTKAQHSGMRQGCPLSPYVFVLVMTCFEKDSTAEISEHVKQKQSTRYRF